ncbi:MAG: T9SS type A sorting domain-containing protein [Bacteroidetes bacterium]|nr:T9SS type A sorting domain-containing protein [Bacteroidota bacterium]
MTGPATACQGSTGYVYTTQNGMSNYTWIVSAGGQITAGAGTTQITVTWNGIGAQTVSVNYSNLNGCLAPTPTVYNVIINGSPTPVITGANNVCVNSGNYTYTTQTLMTAYVWTVSSGGTLNSGQGTNAISVIWTGSGAQTVSVNYTNSSGCSASSPTVYPVTINPIPGAAGTISGTASICAPAAGISYSVAPISGATAYAWTLPVGASIGTGAGTNNITVNFGTNAVSGNITVYGTNLCGAGATSPNYPITVGLLPVAAGTITGPATACTPATGLVYSVPLITNATGYAWTIPAGAMIVSGDNTHSITVDFPSGATSGNLSVYGTNTCGNGTPSANYAVSVAPKPAAPVITENSGILTSDAPAGNQWYKDNTVIPSATGQTYQPTQTGHYTAVVTLNGCSSVPSNDIYFLMTGIDALGQNGTLSVYPNPTDGMVTLDISTKDLQVLDLKVVNNLGSLVYELKDLRVQGSASRTIDLRNFPDGVYSILLYNNNTHILKKIVINK